MNVTLLFRATGIVLGIQLALGGLVTIFGIDPFIHIVWGVLLGILAVVTLVYVARMPSKPKQLMGLAIGIGVAVLIQALLGFGALGTSGNTSNALAFVHFLNALAILAMTIVGGSTTMRMSHMVNAGPGAGNPTA